MAKLINLYFAMISLIILMTSCAPLQQAPLVYASKVSVGVDVSTTTTEQPGLSVNLGYKQIDAAYVPVAVSKPCDKSKGSLANSDCVNTIYGIKQISGSNDVGDSDVAKKSIDAAKERIDKFNTLSQAKKIADEDYGKALINNDNAIKALSVFATKNNLSVTSPTIDETSPDYASIKSSLDTLQATIDKTKAELSTATTNTTKAATDLKDVDISSLASDLKLVGGSDKKSDAYSVFGSFDANTKASATVDATSTPKAEASLMIGKVFSTGVASQNLTQGMRGYYTGIGVARCLIVGENIISEFKKTLTTEGTPAEKAQLQTITANVVNACYGGKDNPNSKN